MRPRGGGEEPEDLGRHCTGLLIGTPLLEPGHQLVQQIQDAQRALVAVVEDGEPVEGHRHGVHEWLRLGSP
jgi:hypothetical protein